MFGLEVSFKVNEHQVRFEAFVQAFSSFLVENITAELRKHIALVSQPALHVEPVPLNRVSKPEPLLVSVSETASLIGVKPSTLRAWILARKIHFVRVGRRVMIPRETINKVCAEGLASRER
jgi:excisionase family DNA binding protein